MTDLTCHWCNEPFTRPHDHGPIPKFCRPSHRQRAHEARQITRLVANLTDTELATLGLQRITNL